MLNEREMRPLRARHGHPRDPGGPAAAHAAAGGWGEAEAECELRPRGGRPRARGFPRNYDHDLSDRIHHMHMPDP